VGVEHIRWTDERPALRRPVLVLAFEGWNDAGDAASTAARHIADRLDAAPFADIDAEIFYDFTDTRPIVNLDNGERSIAWPINEFSASVRTDDDRDVIVVSGLEPQLRWRTYSEQIVGLAKELGVELVISLGALIADVAHSRPTTIYGSTDNAELGSKLDLEPSSYEGPTGIVGVIHSAFQREGIDSVSLWAAVPSYVPHANSPKAALALVDRLAQILGFPILGGDLVEATADYESQITELVSEDDDTRAYVERLESQYDSMGPGSGAELIEELEQFLKEQ
jgi:predicted ATP-grasp superfamily ATP-dependent carboligase